MPSLKLGAVDLINKSQHALVIVQNLDIKKTPLFALFKIQRKRCFLPLAIKGKQSSIKLQR